MLNSKIDSELENICSTWNNHDQGILSWSIFKVSGASTFASAITITPTSNQIILGSTRTITISAPTPATSSRVLTIPDPGANANFVLSEANATINGIKTFAGQLIGKGTATNDSPAAGYIGEIIENAVGSTSYPTSGQYGDLTSIDLTAGDWLISAIIFSELNGSTSVSDFQYGVSTTSGNSNTGLVIGDTLNYMREPTTTNNTGGAMPFVHKKFTGNTTVYLKFRATYSTASPLGQGRITALRIR